MREKGIIITGIEIQESGSDILIQFEQVLYLLGKMELMGLLVSLKFLAQIGGFHFKTQKQLAKLIGLSEPTFIRKRRELEKLGLIEIRDENGKRIIDLKFLSRLKFFKSSSNYQELLKYMDKSAKSLSRADEKEGQLDLTHSIYNILSHKTNNKGIIKGIIKRYPKEHYNIVLNAFKKYKGVGLFGPEIPQHLRAIKTMFKAGRKPKQIVSFMKWLNKYENEIPWVGNWTIWTVQKKIHEFLAGKLKVSDEPETKPL